jgi:hypothetical protein
VTVIFNPPIASKLAQQLRRLAEETAGTLLIYFVGHGDLTDTGELSLVVSETEASDPDLTGLEFNRIRRALLDSPAQVKVVILDCCYAGRTIQGLSSTDETDLADATDISGVYTLTASDGTAHVVPLSEQESLPTSFTGVLVDIVRQGLLRGPAVLTLGDLYPELRQRLRARCLPEPNQRNTDTAIRHPFTRNISFNVGRAITCIPLTISADDTVQFDLTELGSQLTDLMFERGLRSLSEDVLEGIRPVPGLYELHRRHRAAASELVYVGGTEQSLQARLQAHLRKIKGRRFIDPGEVFFLSHLCG